MIVSKNENVIFHECGLNMDISLSIPYQAFKFQTCDKDAGKRVTTF